MKTRPQQNDQRSRRPQQSQRPAFQPFGGRGSDPAEIAFYAGTPVDPSPRILLEKGSAEFTMRAMDLICPIGMGQRGLIVAPPGSGKTTILKHICQAVGKAYPQVKLYCLLVDERPEEVTDFRRSVAADVRASSSDQDYEHHVRTADELMREAMREAGTGRDVMVLIDSLTRLSRVHNAEMRSSGRTISGGLDARAIEVPRRIFGAARKIENGGSLTILATILVETGSRMDDVIFEEFKGTGNMEVVLSRELSSRRIYPAIDIPKSATRKMELLMDPAELKKVEMLRRALLNYKAVEAGSALIKQLEKYPTNQAFLAAVGEVISAD
ncbi:MAG: transcription termination factor Rho [Candidatus Omnitrophica bacterium]|nr:transcription termination factor Rho [Candidatus Omnitrophota bacterium]